MKKNDSILSIFFHNYYGNDAEWITFFSNQFTIPFNLFFNGVSGSYYRLSQNCNLSNLAAQASTPYLNQVIVKESTNIGKDIGGKLVLMDAFLKLGVSSDYLLFLHDKQSPYHANSEQWQKELFRIAENTYQDKILDIFRNNPKAGMVAAEHTIRNEQDNERKSNAYIDSSLITSLKEQYNISPPHLQFVAGTMFWVRANIFEDFFKLYPPLAIRSQLETGNVTDESGPTITHAWERLLCWIVTSKGYQIKGV